MSTGLVAIDRKELEQMRYMAKYVFAFCDKMLQNNDGNKTGVVSTTPPAKGKKPLPADKMNKILLNRKKQFEKK